MMASDVATFFAAVSAANAVTYVTAATAVVGGSVALVNYRRSVAWKKAELANGFVKELLSNNELVFACRALDWNGGLLVIPESLRPLLKDDSKKTIEHERHILHEAM